MGRPSYHLLWAQEARRDLTGIIDYISIRNPERAWGIIDRIDRLADSLKSMPQRGRIVPELENQGVLLYREKVLSLWRILYRVDGETVYILAVLDGRRRLEETLLARILRE